MLKDSRSTSLYLIYIPLTLTYFVVLIDIVFSLIAPRSVYLIPTLSVNDKLFIFTFDALLTYLLVSSFTLIYYLTRNRATILIFSMAGILHITNWCTFVVVGEFLGADGILFAVQNLEQIVWHIGQISPWYVIALIILVLGTLVLLSSIYKNRMIAPGHEIILTKLKFAAIPTFLVILLLGSVIISTTYQNISGTTKSALRFRTSPLLSILFDFRKPENIIEFQPGMSELYVSWQEQRSLDFYHQRAKTIALPYPVVLIVVESLRHDVLDTPHIMPNLFELKSHSTFLKAYAPSNTTAYSWPSVFNSQYPLRNNYRYQTSHAKYPKTTVYDILKRFGYRTAVFSAQNEQWCGMINSFNLSGLDIFYSADRSGTAQGYVHDEDPGFASFVKQFKLKGKLDDSIVAQKAIEWISNDKTAKFFVGINFQRSHFPYTWPSSFKPPYPEYEPQNWFYPSNQVTNMRSRYFNALRYTDDQLGKVFHFLKTNHLYDDSLIIVAGDHGESFLEHGQTCHGNYLFNESVLTSVVIKPPRNQKPLIIHKIPELIDLPPSILDILGLPAHEAFQGKSLFSPSPSKSPIFMTVNSPIAEQDAIILDDWKLIKDYRNDQLILFDLKNDPKEGINLESTNPVETRRLLYLLMKWRKEQLKYYANTAVHTQYYPPRYSIQD